MTYQRSFRPIEWMLRDDGRTVDGRIVPYNEVVEVVERNETTGKLEAFKENFLPNSCKWVEQNARAKGNASWIEFRMEHGTDFDGLIGYARSIESRDDGAYASFRLYESPDLPKVQSMLRESHTGLSVYFTDRVAPKVEGGIINRVQVHIGHVAATPVPVYQNAKIMAMRGIEDDALEVGGTPRLDEVKELLLTLKR